MKQLKEDQVPVVEEVELQWLSSNPRMSFKILMEYTKYDLVAVQFDNIQFIFLASAERITKPGQRWQD